MHLAVHNIKQREGKSTRGLTTRYTDDTLQILGLHDDQRISGFIHGLRTRSLVEHLSTDLPFTYKGLMEKTYTWIDAREVATNGAPSDRRENFKRSKKSSWDNNRGQKGRDRQGESYTRDNTSEDFIFEGRKIIFPLVTRGSNSSAPVIIKAKIFGREVGRVHMDSGSSCEVNYKHYFMKLKPSIRASKIDSKVPLIGFLGEKSWSSGEIPLEIMIGDPLLARKETLKFVIVRSNSSYNMFLGRTSMQKIGIVVSTIHRAIKFHTVKGIGTVFLRYNSKKIKEGMKKLPKHFKERLRDLLRSNADVFAWTHADMTGIPKTIMIKGKPFKTEHKLNEYSHIKPIKQKRQGLGPDRNTTTCKEVEKLTKAGILQKVKHQAWVANPIMVKKSD
ncbi:hypothetical protein Tco_0752841 [Tanacetum coccineum]|uniref:Reverse transcriptase domain-containing protein n=1 Tax=Tanacetum coccineum TaxID=301880 RepID=A0ABQ4Z906_9ASTR